MTTAGAGQRHAEKSSQRQLMRSATEISARKVELWWKRKIIFVTFHNENELPVYSNDCFLSLFIGWQKAGDTVQYIYKIWMHSYIMNKVH